MSVLHLFALYFCIGVVIACGIALHDNGDDPEEWVGNVIIWPAYIVKWTAVGIWRLAKFLFESILAGIYRLTE